MKILVLETRKLSYGSSSFFLAKICGALRARGHEAIHRVITDVEADSALLESFIGKSFDAVIDINSILPLVCDEDGARYLDGIDAPFFNFIVDHPMHVHEYLNVKLERYYVICLDRCHKEYVEKYYPHIKGVKAVPLGGARAGGDVRFEDRKHGILFPATYTPPSYYRSILKDEGLLGRADRILSRILDGDARPVHEMYMEDAGLCEKNFADGMYAARCIDRYIRDYFRERAVEEILCAGFQIDAVGARWEMYGGRGRGGLKIYGGRSYAEALEMISDAKIVLNAQPLFIQAPHDRVFNAMANGAAVLTDSCEYIEKKYARDMLLYDRISPKESISKLSDAIRDGDLLKKMASRLKECAEASETWEDRCGRIERFIKRAL